MDCYLIERRGAEHMPGTCFILPEIGAYSADQKHEKWAVEKPEGRMDWSVLNKEREKSYNQGEKVWPLARPLVVKIYVNNITL